MPKRTKEIQTTQCQKIDSPCKGFTLLELIIVLILASMVAVMVTRPLASIFDIRMFFEDEVTAKEDLNFFLLQMSREAKRMDQEAAESTVCGNGEFGDWEFNDEANELARDGVKVYDGDNGKSSRIDKFECTHHPDPVFFELRFRLDNDDEIKTLAAPRY